MADCIHTLLDCWLLLMLVELLFVVALVGGVVVRRVVAVEDNKLGSSFRVVSDDVICGAGWCGTW